MEVKEVLVSENAIDAAFVLLKRIYGKNPVLWVLSDENTEAAAGNRFKSGVRASKVLERILPGEPHPIPTLELAQELGREVKAASPNLLVSVGSGVISDLVKKVSLDTGIPNWCIATAPSMDAYTSATAAIRVKGYHSALPARISEAVVCDLGVIDRAPTVLFLSGLGDLLAKFYGALDWYLSNLMTGEHYCKLIADFALGSARKALDAARALGSNHLEATRALTDAIIVSGLAMQAIGGSRPAASAEHTIAHFWEMASVVGRADLDLHGVLVGAASKLVLNGYLAFYRGLEEERGPGVVDAAKRLMAFDKEPGWEEVLEDGLRPFKGKIAEEMGARSFNRAILEKRLKTIAMEMDRLVGVAKPLLDELSAAVRVLEDQGFPFALEELGIEEKYRMLPVRNARLLRNRYTTFNLAYELGMEERLVGEVGVK